MTHGGERGSLITASLLPRRSTKQGGQAGKNGATEAHRLERPLPVHARSLTLLAKNDPFTRSESPRPYSAKLSEQTDLDFAS